MVNAYLKSRHRLFALGCLLALSFLAAGRNVAQEEKAPRQEWPRQVDASVGKITIYEPQLESLRGAKLSSRAAVSVLLEGSTEPVFGAVWMESTLVHDAETNTGRPENIRIVELRLPSVETGRVLALREAVTAEVSRWKQTYRMDAVLAEIRQLEERKAAAQALKAEVPEIHFRAHPAVLVAIDGDPEWRAVAGTPYKRLANSSFFIVEESDGGKCYLRISPFWWVAASPLGPWQVLENAPAGVEELWKKEPRPQVKDDDVSEEESRRPEVITSTRPAELVWTDGLPQYAPIAGTDLLYVKNTSNDVFLEISSQMSYVLLSGRWFRTVSTKVAWEFVASDKLPADFARIPVGSEKQHVLACVAGTAEAREAVKNAEIPQTEAVKPGPAPDLRATYDGEPQFTQIPDTQVQYAANSPSPIFYTDRRYYWCEDGIWYDSDYAVGPWSVCSYVPRPIYLIPPSCPFYYATYCRIFSVSPYSITYGYYPGYRGCYVWGPSVVYGTGYWYRPWRGSTCYIRPSTWGIGVRYNSWAGSWTFGLGWGTSCSWSGWSYYRRAPAIAVGIGGGCNVRYGYGYRNSVGVDVAVPLSAYRKTDNLYVRQPTRIVRRVEPEAHRPPQSARPILDSGPRRVQPGPVRPDPTVRPDRDRDRDRDDVRPRPPGRDRDEQDVKPRDPQEPQNPKLPRARDNDRDPEPQNPKAPRVDREREPQDPKPPRPDREPQNPKVDRDQPKPPPPVERRQPPPPPPVERREPPRNPPPPVERREPPRNPPPPPREERRAPPPPPPVERREPPRSPPPQQDRGRNPKEERSPERSPDRRK